MESFSISIDTCNTIFCTNGKVTYVSVKTPYTSGSANRSDNIFYKMLSGFIEYLSFDKLKSLVEGCPEDDILKDIVLEKIAFKKSEIEALEKLIDLK